MSTDWQGRETHLPPALQGSATSTVATDRPLDHLALELCESWAPPEVTGVSWSGWGQPIG